MIFENKRKFKLWSYSVSHSTLIIRSEKQYEDVDYPEKYEPNCTIDIEFKGVEFISLPDKLNEVHLVKKRGRYIFNDNSGHFVIATSCMVGLSQFNQTKDRISQPSLFYDEVLMSL